VPQSSQRECADASVLLVSPVHNEGAHLERVAAGLLAQTHHPDLWLVVDDGSTDSTRAVLETLESRLPFLRVVRTPDLTAHAEDRNLAGGPDRAFNFGLEQVDWRSFTHIGKLDGDIVLPPDYVQGLLRRFAEDPTLGVAGGAVLELAGSEWKLMRTPPDQVTAPARIYTRECFESIDGMPACMGADVITTMRAQMHGYRTRTFLELPVRHLRAMGSAQGMRRGRMRQGAYQYIVHYSAWWIVLRSFAVALRFRPYGLSGIWFLAGYVKAAFGPLTPVQDPALRTHVRRYERDRLRRVVNRFTARRHG
jgi:GT2 family glycosyltransferase